VEKIGVNTALAIAFIATALVMIGGLALVPTTMQSASAVGGGGSTGRGGGGGGCGNIDNCGAGGGSGEDDPFSFGKGGSTTDFGRSGGGTVFQLDDDSRCTIAGGGQGGGTHGTCV
jgi:hypothetical protein